MSSLFELSWPQLPAGNRIRYIWQEWLQNQLEDYQGGLLMTVDSLTQCLSMPDNVYDYHLKVGPSLAHSFQADPELLPVMTDSIQASIVSFGFEYTETSTVLLGEIHRALAPQGYIYSLIYAPHNPWYHQAKLGLAPSKSAIPKHQISLSRYKDWLSLLGFDIQQCEPIGCAWWRGFAQFHQQKNIKPAWLSIPIAYMIKAQKKVSTMTPIKPLEENLSLAMAGKLANVSTNISAKVSDQH